MASSASRGQITLLSRDVIERIAAGEVIERPASVVRELIDNALDARASSIRVELQEGGLRLIRVSDNGVGIAAEDIALACKPHTTSKVRTIEDLSHISTLGFRGEALASIAMVAELEVISATNEADVARSLLLRPGDDTGIQGNAARPTAGTTVTVRELFVQVPARRGMLRGPRTEAARAVGVVRDYALAHPAVRFAVTDDGRLVFQTPGNDLLSAIGAIYGSDMQRASLPFGPLTIDDFTMSGIVGSRAFTFPSREHSVVAINGRPVSNRALFTALESGYRPLLRKGRHPLLMVQISAPPEQLDVNIHPGKMEVLLRQETAITPPLREAIHQTLSKAAVDGTRMTPRGAHSIRGPVQLYLPTGRRRRLTLGENRRTYGPNDRYGMPHYGEEPAIAPLPNLRTLGQMDDTLILAQSEHGDLYLVDQHRAHERILYQRLLQQRMQPGTHADGRADAGELPARQMLLEPLIVELMPSQAALLMARLDELAELGLDCQHFGGSAFLVRALPQLPGSAHQPGAFARELTHDAAEDADDWLDHIRISLACRSAVRRGELLTDTEQQKLLDDLRSVAAVSVCPHGSPLILRYSKSFLARAFEW